MSGTVIVIGYLSVVLRTAGSVFPEANIVLVDDTEVVARSRFHAAVEAAPRQELITWPYADELSADEFYHRYRDRDVLAVIPAVEYAVPFAARLSERYQVPGATLGAARLLRDKAALRAASRAAGIANPASQLVTDVGQVLDFIGRHPGPVVIKPTNRQGSVGTRVVRTPADAAAAWEQALSQEEAWFVAYRDLPLRMLVEEYVAGPEFSVEMLVHAGQSQFANVTAKLLHPGDRPIELGHVVPADIPDDLAERLIAATAELMDAIGFGSGLVHCEWIVRDGGQWAGVPYLVECAGRMPGDGIVDLIERAWPIDLVRRYLTVMAGEAPPPPPSRPAGGAAVLYPVVPPGIIASIDGLEEARAVPGVYQCACVLAVGERVNELRSSWDRVVGAASCLSTPAGALAAAQEAIAKVKVVTVPDDGQLTAGTA